MSIQSSTAESHASPIFRELSNSECRTLLGRHSVGRIAFSFHDRVDIQPIHYAVSGDWLYGRTSRGSKYLTLAHNPWCAFEVDEVPVFESSVSPNPPLGLVIWIDNQFAAFTPEGKVGFGVLENPEPAWLEIKDIELQP